MQTYKLEWNTDTGARQLVARVFVQGRRTSAYLPVPESLAEQAARMEEQDNEKPF